MATDYSDKSAAMRGAKRAGLNVGVLEFVQNENTKRWTWIESPDADAIRQAAAQAQAEADDVPAAQDNETPAALGPDPETLSEIVATAEEIRREQEAELAGAEAAQGDAQPAQDDAGDAEQEENAEHDADDAQDDPDAGADDAELDEGDEGDEGDEDAEGETEGEAEAEAEPAAATQPAELVDVRIGAKPGSYVIMINGLHDNVQSATMWAGMIARQLKCQTAVLTADTAECVRVLEGRKAKRERKAADRAARIAAGQAPAVRGANGPIARVIALLRSPDGATLKEIGEATGWARTPGKSYLVALGRRHRYTVEELAPRKGEKEARFRGVFANAKPAETQPIAEAA
jgi:hypothetical protein